MAAAISCSARIAENGTKHIGHAESMEMVDSKYPEDFRRMLWRDNR